MDRGKPWRKIFVAAFLLLVSAVLAGYFITPGLAVVPAGRGGVGPTTWPRVMLIGIACCAAVMLLRELARMLLHQPDPPASTAKAGEIYDNRRAVIGIAILVVYGVAIPSVGFALAT